MLTVRRARRAIAASLAATVATLLSASLARAAPVEAFAYFGGSGDDVVTDAAIASDGSVFVCGTTTSTAIAGATLKPLGGTGGFVARLDPSGTKIVWAVATEPLTQLALDGADQLYVLGAKHVLRIPSDGSAIAWTSPDLSPSRFALSSSGDVGLLVGTHLVRLAKDGSMRFDVDVGRSHVVAIAADPKSGDFVVGGDNNTNPCGPWRSPFLHRYDATGTRTWSFYDIPGSDPNICGGAKLLADAYVTWARFDEAGRLWFAAGTDGGDTVFTKQPADLTKPQAGLVGACFDGPCYGWKGAAKVGFVARVAADFRDLDRATFVVAHFNPAPAACTCDVPNPDGATRANSAVFTRVFPYSGGVVGVGGSAYHFPVTAPWFSDAVYGYAGGVAATLDSDMKTMRMATLLTGTSDVQSADLRGGRLVIVGRAKDPGAAPADAGGSTAIPTTPAGTGALQAAYAGGASDGFVLLACVGTDAECAAPPGPRGDGGPSSADGGGSNAGSAAGGGGSSGGCGCRTTKAHDATGAAIAAGLLLAFGVRRRRR